MNMLIAATLSDWLHLLHLLAAMIWVGGAVTLSALSIQVLRSGEHDAVPRFVRSVRLIGSLVMAPATIAVAAFGIWLVVESDFWDFGQTWIWLGLALLAAAFLVRSGSPRVVPPANRSQSLVTFLRRVRS